MPIRQSVHSKLQAGGIGRLYVDRPETWPRIWESSSVDKHGDQGECSDIDLKGYARIIFQRILIIKQGDIGIYKDLKIKHGFENLQGYCYDIP